MKIRVFINPETLLALLARKGWEQKDLAAHMSVSCVTVTMWVKQVKSPKVENMNKLIDTFKGMSHKPGGRVTWDDMFRTELVASRDD